MRGPTPKRSTERRRMNKPEIPIDTAPAAPRMDAPPLRDGIHPLAAAWYASLAASGQSRWYEPSDWMQAQVVAELVDAYAKDPTANGLTAILKGSTGLMVTEGDRRRLRIELVRAAGDPDEDAAVSALDDYRARLTS